jgi:hypothetical protein
MGQGIGWAVKERVVDIVGFLNRVSAGGVAEVVEP